MPSRSTVALAALVLAVLTAGAPARAAGAGSQVVTGARIAAIAERIARAQISGADRALAPAFQLVDQQVPAGDVAIVPGVAAANPTYVSVPVAIEVDGKVARTVYAGYRVTTFVRTAVAAHDLRAGALITATDLTLVRTPFAGRPGVDADALVGRKLRAACSAGTALYPEATAVNELVRAGMPAVLIVHDGPVALAADVVARTGGGLGDLVTIFNPQTQKALSGVVTGANTVELTLPGAVQ